MNAFSSSRFTCAAVVDTANADFELRQVQLGTPRADEIVVKLEASGMCSADIGAQHGAFPFPFPGVYGHEGVGRVVETGAAVTDLAVGDRVVLSFAWCGKCIACQDGRQAYCDDWFPLNMAAGSRGDGSATLCCEDGSALHGHFFGQSSFAHHVLATARAAIKVPEDVPAEVLAPMGCGIQTGVGAVLNVLKPGPGAHVAVFGAGAVGLAAIMGLKLTGASRVIAVDVHKTRLALALELGATDVVNAADGDSGAQIAALLGGHGRLDGALETSGNPGALRTAVASLTGAGTCVVVGVPHDNTPLTEDVVHMVSRGIRIIGTNQGGVVPRVFIPQLVELYQRGRLPVDKLVKNFAFADINKAAAASHDGSAIKPILQMG